MLAPKLSVIVPCHNEEKVIPIFYEAICDTFEKMPHVEIELWFIDDGSNDLTLNTIKELSSNDPRVRVVSFSRNFGKEAAIYAGLSYANGDYLAIMDSDLQDPPSLLPDMFKAVFEEGYDCAGSRRVSRAGEPVIRSFFARLFYRLINLISETKLVDGARDYRLFNRQVANALLGMPEYNRFSKGLFEWVGFKTKWFEYENIERSAGETKWSFWKLFLYSVEGIIAFSTAPLALGSFLGVLFCIGSIIASVFLVIRQFLWHNSVEGWTSLMCIMMFIFGVQFLCLGIIGQYIAKMYYETKRRPIFIEKEHS